MILEGNDNLPGTVPVPFQNLSDKVTGKGIKYMTKQDESLNCDKIFRLLYKLIPNLKIFLNSKGANFCFLDLTIASASINVIEINIDGAIYSIKIDFKQKEAYVKADLPLHLEIELNNRLCDLLKAIVAHKKALKKKLICSNI